MSEKTQAVKNMKVSGIFNINETGLSFEEYSVVPGEPSYKIEYNIKEKFPWILTFGDTVCLKSKTFESFIRQIFNQEWKK